MSLLLIYSDSVGWILAIETRGLNRCCLMDDILSVAFIYRTELLA